MWEKFLDIVIKDDGCGCGTVGCAAMIAVVFMPIVMFIPAAVLLIVELVDPQILCLFVVLAFALGGVRLLLRRPHN